ncbi:MAG: histidine phosphatase family protein [Betaproteobacteria bacterium]|nr:histidine phosphatase family protein [Betaproteobacteria bacterium]
MVLFVICSIVLPAFAVRCAVADDEQVWKALQEGGKVILLRHAQVVIGEGIGHLSPGHCAEELNLTPHGVNQAKLLGAAFRAHGVSVGEVLSSPFCRCLDTGTLAFGHATPVPFLVAPGTVSDSQAALNNERELQEIRNYRGPSNLVMITHDLNIANVVLEDTVAMGEFFVLQPKGSGFEVIGGIRRYAK